MGSETEKKGLGWFKGVLSNQSGTEKKVAEQQEDVSEVEINDIEQQTEMVEETYSTMTVSQETVSENNNHFFSKSNQDKIALDVIVSIENLLKERELLSYRNKALEDQLNTASEMINRFKQDQIKKDQIIQEKNNEISELETNLTNKQLRYDQLLEDYKAYQLASKMEYEKISNQLETETAKYNKLYEESTNVQYQSMLKINELDEKIRNLEIENQKYIEQYQKIVDEKAKLMQTINDFTERMSFSFSTKATPSNPSDSE